MAATARLGRYMSLLVVEIKRVMYIMQTKQECNRAFLLVGHGHGVRTTSMT